ncbi:MAG: right-handed parallel beta-helix repeat-containing protein [Kiritimatiellae bacterium]|nr:right-handed parallel beta-helix repeat-containing protein [Kiritimatiellia bacterium]
MNITKHKYTFAALAALVMAFEIPAATIAPTAFTSDALKAAIASASAGDTVDLSGFSGTLTVNEVLFPAASMTIRGPADRSVVLTTSIASGSKGHCIFATSDATVTLTLENLAFKNNVTGGWGSQATDNDDRHPGVVRTTGPLVLKNCLFDNNKIIKDEAANTRYGSANVFAAGGLCATDCSFTGTFDNRDSSWDYFGEVVLVAGGTVGVTNCFFSGNGWTGQAAGNFLCVDTASVSFSGCRFEENLAQGGGAVMTIMNGPVVFKDCIFRKCQSYYGKNNMNVPGYGTLHPNQTTIYGNAGALCLAVGSQQVVVENCEFTDCSSFGSARGGAIGWRCGSSGSRIVIANSTFYHCYSADVGGVLESDISYPMYFINCTMTANGAAGRASAIDQNKGEIRLVNTFLAYNYKANEATLQDWYAGTTRYVYDSWVKETHWGTFDSGKYADVHCYASEGSQTGVTYGTAKTTTAFADGDPYAEWAASADFPAVVTENGNFATDRTVTNTGAGPVPVLNADKKRPRVVEIAEGGPLDQTGYYVKHSADWSSIAYSKDGSSWTAMLGTVAGATISLDADQRGVKYKVDSTTSLPRPSIGAAAVEPAKGLTIVVR